MLRHVLGLFFITSTINSYPSGFDGITMLISSGGNAISSIGKLAQSKKPDYIVPPFGSVGRDRALLESENKLSQLDSAYTYAHQFLAGFFDYKPVVDTVKEHEKYGNDAAKGRAVSKAIVDSFDGVANVVNKVIDVPAEKATYLSKTATAALNSIGRTLVGL